MGRSILDLVSQEYVGPESKRIVGASADYGTVFEAVKPITRCKHGAGECERCGTSDRRDAVHSTECGRGVVGRLSR